MVIYRPDIKVEGETSPLSSERDLGLVLYSLGVLYSKRDALIDI